MLRHRFLPRLVLVLLSAVAVAQGAPIEQKGYRLAGVMLAGDSYVGFLELPQGQQMLVRLGSVVDGGKVVAFDAKSLRIRFPDGLVELSLEGSGKPQVVVSADSVVVSGDEQGRVMRREVDVGGLRRELDEAQHADAPRTRSGGPAPDAERTVTQRFAPLLDLPADARVVAVNETQITSASAAIRAVEDTLAKGMPARLNLETPDGTKRMYLMPATTPDGTANTKKR